MLESWREYYLFVSHKPIELLYCCAARTETCPFTATVQLAAFPKEGASEIILS